MPIYEYACTDCGHQLEALQKMSDAPLTDCPACGAASLRKKISAAAFRLSGGGWYETDFKSGNKRNLKEADSKAAKPAGAKPSEGGGTAKPKSGSSDGAAASAA